MKKLKKLLLLYLLTSTTTKGLQQKMQEPLQQLTGKSYIAPVPEKFWKIIKETKWEHGIQEALEVQH